MRMKAIHIIKREYMESIKKKSFIISTILAPVLLLVLYSIPILALVFEPGEQVSIAVLDRSGLIGDDFAQTMTDTLKNGEPRYLTSVFGRGELDLDARKDELFEAVGRGELDVLLEIPEDILEVGAVNYISKDVFSDRTMDDIRGQLNPIVISARFAGEGLDYETVSRLTRRISFNENKVTRSGVMEEEQVVGEFVLVIVFCMILYMSLLSWGLSVQRSVIEEKSSRVIEVMLSSVEPRDLFIGKIIGIGSLGLTQITIWGVLLLAIGFSSSFATAQFMQFVHIDPVELLYFGLFFVLGFLLYSAMFTTIGAVCNTDQEAQQLQMIVMLPLIIPFMLMFVIIQNPNTTFAAVLSYIPFFAPILMLARVVLSEPGFWEIAFTVALLLVTIYAVILFSARIFRVGILMYGKRPGLREILKWFRYA